MLAATHFFINSRCFPAQSGLDTAAPGRDVPNPEITAPLCWGSCPTCDMVTVPLPQTCALLTGRPPRKPQGWAEGGHRQGSKVAGLPNLQGLQHLKEFPGVRPGGPSLLLEGGVQ